MRNTALAGFLVLLLANAYETHAQAPQEAFFNVFQIRVSGATGTAFTMRVDGRQYLITAKHMVGKLKADGSPESIEILTGGGPLKPLEWKPLPARIFPCDDPVDIAVLVTQELVGRSQTRDFVESSFGEQSLEPRPDVHALGQEGYFLGFPFGFAPAEGPVGPLPFSKKATLSLNYWEGKSDRMLFDGYNNPGFSGAPVVFRDPRMFDQTARTSMSLA
jgi:S1-C subfamily serine protease